MGIANRGGLKALTIAQLAKEFQVKPPSLYKHIKNLKEIIDELGILFMKEIIEVIQKNSFALSGEDVLKEVCRTYRAYSIINPGLYQSMQLTHVKRRTEYQTVALTLIDLIRRVIEPYKVKKKNQIHAIRNLRCILHGFIDLEIQQGFGMPDDLEKSFELSVEAYILSLKQIY